MKMSPTIYVSDKDALPKRHEKDFYKTPKEFAESAVTQLYLDLVIPDGFILRYLDVGCGDGVWGRAVKGITPSAVVDGIDIKVREGQDIYNNIFIGDYLNTRIEKYDIILGNPPFSLMMDFISKSLELADIVAFLLPVNFLESQKRYQSYFSGLYKPTYVYQSVQRINFTGKSNPNQYIFVVWSIDQNYRGEDTILRWLDWR